MFSLDLTCYCFNGETLKNVLCYIVFVLSLDLLVSVGPQTSAGPPSPCCWDDLLP